MKTLGLDSSTQSLTAVIIDTASRRIVRERSVNFDRDLPHYGTRNGVHRPGGEGEVHSPPGMWLEALDVLLTALRADGVDFSEIGAVSGSGQQHGSVYLKPEAATVLGRLDAGKTLAAQFEGMYTRAGAPIWMDSSTGAECEEIQEALGGMETTVAATGSATFERFTGPQIRKFFKQDPETYHATGHIALVSSFLASVMAGRIAPIDHADGAGMNLMDIHAKAWHPGAMEATAPGLLSKLPPLAASSTVIGPVSPYFVRRYGFSPDCRALVWSGDNPCSIIGLGLVSAGQTAISLGTSDTFFGTMSECRTDPRGEGHVFGSPTGQYMTLICFKNGSLARERVAQSFQLDWAAFSQAIEEAPPGNEGRLLLPWYDTEIVPRVRMAGAHRRGLDKADVSGMCRAVVEGQMMSMRLHSRWMELRPSEIFATGGASSNETVLQIMADVHQCPVRRLETTNSAALGAALRAAHGALTEQGAGVSWSDVVAGFTHPSGTPILPRTELATLYEELIADYAHFESMALEAVERYIAAQQNPGGVAGQ
jgi:xylulokinase